MSGQGSKKDLKKSDSRPKGLGDMGRSKSGSNLLKGFTTLRAGRSKKDEKEAKENILAPVFGKDLAEVVGFQRSTLFAWASDGGPPIRDYSSQKSRSLGRSSSSKKNAASGGSVTERPRLDPNLSQDELSGIRKRVRESWVPIVVRDGIEAVLATGLQREGIFRISGVSADMELIKAKYDEGLTQTLRKLSSKDGLHKDCPMVQLDNTTGDAVHSAAGLLKQYLRDLPEPLLTSAKYQTFAGLSEAAKGYKESDEYKAAITTLGEILTTLPAEHRMTVRVVLKFLHIVVAHTKENKMTSGNIGVVFGPNFMRSPTPMDKMTPQMMMQESEVAKTVTTFMVEEAGTVFKESRHSKHSDHHVHTLGELLRIIDDEQEIQRDIEMVVETVVSTRKMLELEASALSIPDDALEKKNRVDNFYVAPSVTTQSPWAKSAEESPTNKKNAEELALFKLAGKRERVGRPDQLEKMTKGELMDEKDDLREELRNWEDFFAAKYQRDALKEDKQAMRHIYARYKQVRGMLEMMGAGSSLGKTSSSSRTLNKGGSFRTASESPRKLERGTSSVGKSPSSSSLKPAADDSAPNPSKSPAGSLSRRSGRPEDAPPETPDAPSRDNLQRGSSRQLTRQDSKLSSSASVVTGDLKRRESSKDLSKSADVLPTFDDPIASVDSPSRGSFKKSPFSEKEVAKLRDEKKYLQNKLYQFQLDFEAKHGRPVKSSEDRTEVIDDYRRYKELKVLLALAGE